MSLKFYDKTGLQNKFDKKYRNVLF